MTYGNQALTVICSQDMDSNAEKCKGDSAVKSGKWSFAARYRAFMGDRFTGTQPQSINQAIQIAFRRLGAQQILLDLATAKTFAINQQWPSPQAEQIAKNKWSAWNQRLQLLKNKHQRPPSMSVTRVWDPISERDTDDSTGSRDSCPLQPTSQTATTLSTVVSASQMSESGSESPSSTATVGQNFCTTNEDCENMSCEEDQSAVCRA
ncbi:hypothetical protein ACJ41O_012243 [Fusarium nematophilum]